MEMYCNDIPVFVILGYCEADEDKRKIEDLEYCPLFNDFCNGDCPCYKEESND